MNKFIIFVLLLALVLSYTSADDGPSNNRVVVLTNKATNGVKAVADGVSINVERLASTPPHQPGQSNILVSAGKGVGRLLRNLTVEAGRFVGTVAGGAVNLARRSTGAMVQTVRDSANRIANPRHLSARPSGEVSTPKAEEEAMTTATTDNGQAPAATTANGQAPNELQKQE